MPISPKDAEVIKVNKDDNESLNQFKWLCDRIDKELINGNRKIKYRKEHCELYESGDGSVWIYDMVLLRISDVNCAYDKAGWELSIMRYEKRHWFLGNEDYIELTFKPK